MDEKQLFRCYQSKYGLSNWFNAEGQIAQSENEINWIYCGVNNDFNSELVKETIRNFFAEDEVYLCISSNRCLLVQTSVVDIEISKILHKKELGIMNKSFTKIVYFSTIGVFKLGIIRDFPKNQDRPLGNCLKVRFFANMVTNSTSNIASMVQEYFPLLEKGLNKDYGGSMEHLWIDLELVEGHKPWLFRFQKRVNNPTSYTEFYSYDVGHYSVQPDFEKLKILSTKDEICSYVFELLYQSTKILEEKQRKLGGFNAIAFRRDFLTTCKEMGCLFAGLI